MDSGAPSEPNSTGDILAVAQDTGSFQTLLTAVQAAGLVDVLKGDGPFTVFAPTDEAFAAIPQAELDMLLADKEALTAVLTHHVVPGRVYASDVANIDSAETVNGQSVSIKVWSGKVMVDNATVIATDIEATNGVIHVIDAVILPEM